MMHSLLRKKGIGGLGKEFLSCFKRSITEKLKSQFLNHFFKLKLVEDGSLEFYKFVKGDFPHSSVRSMEKEGKQPCLLSEQML